MPTLAVDDCRMLVVIDECRGDAANTADWLPATIATTSASPTKPKLKVGCLRVLLMTWAFLFELDDSVESCQGDRYPLGW